MTSGRVTACCKCTPVVETEFEDAWSASTAVVEAVAAVDDTAPTELPPLYETVDTDALDQLCGGRRSTPTTVVRFRFAGWTVLVRDDGRVRVCDPDRESECGPAFEKPLDRR